MPIQLTAALAMLQRGPFAGQLQGFDAAIGLVGWACRLDDESLNAAEEGQSKTATIRLTVEDLFDSRRRWKLETLIAHRPRPDLQAQGLPLHCGFAFLGHCGGDLPPPSSGLVVRAYFDDAQQLELPGSPLRLDAELYQQLRRLCRTGLGRRARIAGVRAATVFGWAQGQEPLQLSWDGSEPVPIAPPGTVNGEQEWPFEQALPVALCDGAVHHLELSDSEGNCLDERLELLPFHLTPWPALLEHSRPPFPDHLSPLAREHYRSLQTWLTWSDADGTPLPPGLPLLQRLLNQPLPRDEQQAGFASDHEAGADGSPEPRHPLHLPISHAPEVSIVIPVHNQYGVTRRCLAAIAYAPTRVPFELIVVDDGSSDDTATALQREAEGVRVVRHEFARGFNQACCSGAALASGSFILLLNNDTEPCARWLEELLAPFQLWPDTGLVGSQLVMSDGRLQESGGIVWGNGEPWNVGRGNNPYDPRYSYTREVDYVSGAALMIRRELWSQVGGFSPEFSPAYYEDTDLAFKVREAGWRVRCAPLARVVHHEGISHGNASVVDPATQPSGGKRYQEINAPLFRQKWAQAFSGPTEPSHSAAELVKDRGILGRALFIDHDTPRPDRDAGSHAALVEMELVQQLGWKVTFLPVNLAWLGDYSETLQRRGIELIHAPFVLSMEQLLRERGADFDLIYITRYSVAAQAIPLIRSHAPQARLLFCNADLHYLRQLRAARAEALTGEAATQALAAVSQVKQQELAVMRQVHLTLSYSEVERAVIEAETLGEASTAPCPWVVEGPVQPQPLEQRSGLAFLGSYNHPPNRDAVEAFLAELWPTLQQRDPARRLHLYGSGLSPELRQRWSAQAGVEVHGWVANTAVVFERHRLFVAPLRSGAGLKGKVIAAAAHGLPQVLSPLAAEATGLRHGQEVLVANDASAWLEAIERLERDDDAWRAMSCAAHRFAQEHYGHEQGLRLMRQALQRLGLPTR
jgi:GT2 family glycosyltransferase